MAKLPNAGTHGLPWRPVLVGHIKSPAPAGLPCRAFPCRQHLLEVRARASRHHWSSCRPRPRRYGDGARVMGSRPRQIWTTKKPSSHPPISAGRKKGTSQDSGLWPLVRARSGAERQDPGAQRPSSWLRPGSPRRTTRHLAHVSRRTPNRPARAPSTSGCGRLPACGPDQACWPDRVRPTGARAGHHPELDPVSRPLGIFLGRLI